MSTENIRIFFEKAKGNPELREKIAVIARLEPEPKIEALCKLSEQVGTPFDAEEFAAIIPKTGALSDAQLEGVAGGVAQEYEEMWAQDAAELVGYHSGG